METREPLFGEQSEMTDMYSIMLRIPQLKNNLEEITKKGIEHSQIADITKAWVNGKSIEDIAREFFKGGENQTKALTAVCKVIYKTLVNNGTWGISALSRIGIDFDGLSDTDKRQINMIPAMIYHGVKTEEGVLLRMNSVPRSIAESLGNELKKANRGKTSTAKEARSFLKQSDNAVWEQAKPNDSSLTGEEYKRIWKILSGEER